jgi:hypothetical protein
MKRSPAQMFGIRAEGKRKSKQAHRTFAAVGFEAYPKLRGCERLLVEMNRLMPWAEWFLLVKPLCPKGTIPRARAGRAGQDVVPEYTRSLAYFTGVAWPFFAFVAVMSRGIIDVLFGPRGWRLRL